jgi:hypothetical protein
MIAIWATLQKWGENKHLIVLGKIQIYSSSKNWHIYYVTKITLLNIQGKCFWIQIELNHIYKDVGQFKQKN